VVDAYGIGDVVESPWVRAHAEQEMNVVALLQEPADEIRADEPRATREECPLHDGRKWP